MEIGVLRLTPRVAAARRPICEADANLRARGELSIAANNSIFSDVYLVGAAGFEPRPALPKTAALPGCAIPRLSWEAMSIQQAPASKPFPAGRLSPIEQRVGHPVAGLDAVFLRRAGDHLKDGPGGPAGE